MYHVTWGANQYAPMTGVRALREAIAQKAERSYGYQPDADSNIAVTTGVTEALYVAITALVRSGNGVIRFDPSYDSYAPATVLSGGIMKRVVLQPPHFRADWQELTTLLSERTRLVALNILHNPGATVWQQADFTALWQAVTEHGIFVISDEVYEHINFSQQGHASALAHPQLRGRAVAVSSPGKTYHMTGWKVDYCAVPAPISTEVRKVHQYLTFSVNIPVRLALADVLRTEPGHYLALPDFYRQKRGVLMSTLSESRLEILLCEGTYFLPVDYSVVFTLDDVESCQWLTRGHSVAAIPLLVFCADPFPHKLIRLCFAKKESALLTATECLCQL